MEILPLFPLNTVLFPGIPLTLHIFEERYKLMMGECLRTKGPFGVVLIRKGLEALGPLAKPHTIGCSARIIQVQHLEDGRMNITAVGLERFRIHNLYRDLPYLVGEVEDYPLQQEGVQGMQRAAARLQPWVLRYLQTLAEAGDVQVAADDLPDDPQAMAYLAAYVLQVPQATKQELLSQAKAIQLLRKIRRLYRQEIALLGALLADHPQSDPAPFSLN
jgi:Lon protease-like protein